MPLKLLWSSLLLACLLPLGARAARPAHPLEPTPASLPGCEPFVFKRVGDVELRLHVAKPAHWTADDRRPCLIAFFGGGWNNGSPRAMLGWIKWAAEQGIVGIAPDYRVRDRQGVKPEDCVADGRSAVAWVERHAAALGIDAHKIVVAGSSAGGHVAAWTAIARPGPGLGEPPPPVAPAALVLWNPVTRTTDGGYGGTRRFDGNAARALACSVPDQLTAHMPPTLIFHGTADKTVPFGNAEEFRDRMEAKGNACELISFAGLGHTYMSPIYGEAGRRAAVVTRAKMLSFFTRLGLLPGR